jgi:hypothetical protein
MPQHRLRPIHDVTKRLVSQSELPGPFDKVLAVNSLQFDGLEQKVLQQITNHLVADGLFAITFQPRGSNPSDEKALAFAQKVVSLLQSTGLTDCRIETLPLEPVSAVCVLARKPL